ncbi:MAG TPA: hypothetical protein VGW40_13610 [Allosphingosinicella sp.]|nr:hypothetical protein [Allosphingosinicella sp.]
MALGAQASLIIRPIISAALAVIILLPSLLLMLHPSLAVAIILTITASFLMLPRAITFPTQVSYAVATAAATLVAITFSSPDAEANVWVLGIPSALLMIRPWVAVFLYLVLIGLGTFFGLTLVTMGIWILICAITSVIVYHAACWLIARFITPVSSHISVVGRLVSIYMLYLLLSTTWFSIAYWSIQNNHESAFTSTGGNIQFLDFWLYAGLLNTAGEPIFLTPASQIARVATFAEMVVSYGFTAIYLAVVLSKILEARSSS